jgi:hypothetical protein
MALPLTRVATPSLITCPCAADAADALVWKTTGVGLSGTDNSDYRKLVRSILLVLAFDLVSESAMCMIESTRALVAGLDCSVHTGRCTITMLYDVGLYRLLLRPSPVAFHFLLYPITYAAMFYALVS